MIDWDWVFRPTALAVLFGGPFTERFFNPPWSVFPLIPFALLPDDIGRIAFLVASVIGYAITVHRLGAKLTALPVVFFAMPVWFAMTFGNIEWLALLGLAMPPSVGLLFLAIKPQMTVGVIVLLAARALKSDMPIRNLVVLFAPTALMLIVSYAIWGTWWAHTLRYNELAVNYSFFPWSIGVGAGLLALALRRDDVRLALTSGIFFFPVVSFTAYAGVVIALTPYLSWLALSTIVTWAVMWMTR
jgi:hypothetical protein